MRVKCELPHGKVTAGGSIRHRESGKRKPERIFAVSSATAFLRDGEQFRWPDSADVWLEFPLESPVLIETLREIPAEPVEIAEGVRWEIDPLAGYDPDQPSPATRYSAAVLESVRDNSLVDYDARIFKRGSNVPLPRSFTTVRERDGMRHTVEVSDPFPEPGEVDRVEFYRQRFARAKIPDVRIRTDL